jgi:hypothetical protein
MYTRARQIYEFAVHAIEGPDLRRLVALLVGEEGDPRRQDDEQAKDEGAQHVAVLVGLRALLTTKGTRVHVKPQIGVEKEEAGDSTSMMMEWANVNTTPDTSAWNCLYMVSDVRSS